ncbi:MAG: VWA domain-containing protein [Acidobacteria bacterium]|nr:VWA domain-containing protein [Acidobacteriota bacterium]MBI3424987.1 VWA domain-containing protein [Acidobacteriota bacterium]
MLKKVSAFLALIVSLFALLNLAVTHAQQTGSGATSGSTPQQTQAAAQKQEAKPATPPQDPPKPARPDDPIITERTDLVSLTVTVTDPYNRLVTGLEKKHFEIFEDKVKQNIDAFKDDDVPVSVGIVFDVSGSMKGKIDRSREALKAFVDTSHDDDDFFLVAFNQRASLVSEFTDGTTLANKLTLVDAKGQTAIYDAVYLGIEKVKQGRQQKHALLLISDGQDNSSRYTYGELRKLLKEAGVQIYCIGIVEMGGGAGSSLDMQGQGILEEIAQTTGGKAFFPRSAAELEDATTRIALELRHQYSMSYTPTNVKSDGQWHKIKIKVTPPRGLPPLTVRTKDGYYAITKSAK